MQRTTIQNQDGVISDLLIQCDSARQNLVMLEAELATTRSSWEARLCDSKTSFTARINKVT